MYVEPKFTIYWKDYIRKRLKQLWKFNDHTIDKMVLKVIAIQAGGMICDGEREKFAVCLDNLAKRWQNNIYLERYKTRKTFEQDVARVISHEHMHLIIQVNEGDTTSAMMDNIARSIGL